SSSGASWTIPAFWTLNVFRRDRRQGWIGCFVLSGLPLRIQQAQFARVTYEGRIVERLERSDELVEGRAHIDIETDWQIGKALRNKIPPCARTLLYAVQPHARHNLALQRTVHTDG